MTTVRPSFHPSSLSPCTKAATHLLQADGVAAPKNPIVGGLPLCCARVTSGHADAPPTSVMNSRRFTRSPHRREREATVLQNLSKGVSFRVRFSITHQDADPPSLDRCCERATTGHAPAPPQYAEKFPSPHTRPQAQDEAS